MSYLAIMLHRLYNVSITKGGDCHEPGWRAKNWRVHHLREAVDLV